jgi:hypothetical protein
VANHDPFNPAKRFDATIGGSEKGRVYLELPFDPAGVWGPRDRYHVNGTIDGSRFRGVIELTSRGAILPMGPAWRTERGFAIGDTVPVTLAIEGPQRDALAEDVATALDDAPAAALFWDSLAPFYRKGYLSWINATKRSPDIRAQRIAELVVLLQGGHKQRPR